jgi:phospholipase C
MPATAALAARAGALPGRTKPTTPVVVRAPVQAAGVRPSRALPYRLNTVASVGSQAVQLRFRNAGSAGAVFHVYDRLKLQAAPHRFTVEAGKSLDGSWPLVGGASVYDLWVLGPNGFHRHFAGARSDRLEVQPNDDGTRLLLRLHNDGLTRTVILSPNAYGEPPRGVDLRGGGQAAVAWPVSNSAGWYDLTITDPASPGFIRRLAGRIETGRSSTSDPAMGGPALMTST